MSAVNHEIVEIKQDFLEEVFVEDRNSLAVGIIASNGNIVVIVHMLLLAKHCSSK